MHAIMICDQSAPQMSYCLRTAFNNETSASNQFDYCSNCLREIGVPANEQYKRGQHLIDTAAPPATCVDD